MRCSMPSLTNSTDTQFFTVFSETDSRSPICRLVRPSPISSRTLRSRAVSPAQPVVPVRLVPQPGDRPARRARIQQRPAGGGHADRAGQIAAADLLEHVAGRSGHDRIQQRLVVAERGEHQAGYLRRPRPDFPADRHPVTIGQPDIEHRDGGAQRRNLGQCGGCGARPRRSPGCPARPPGEHGSPGGRSPGPPGRTRRSAFSPDRRAPCCSPGLSPDLRTWPSKLDGTVSMRP